MGRVLSWIVGFGRFWYGFIFGDDWTVAAAIAIGLAITALLNGRGVPAWWLCTWPIRTRSIRCCTVMTPEGSWRSRSSLSSGMARRAAAMRRPLIMARIQAIIDGQPTPPADFKDINAKHAVERADATKEEVLDRLRSSGRRIAAALRAIPDDKLDLERQLPSGVMTVQQRIERVLIGHVQSHQAHRRH